MEPVTIVSGPPGAGKTTLCGMLAQRHEPSVHLHTDVFYGAIEQGFVAPHLPAAHDQNHVCVTAAARACGPYAEAGYHLFVDGVVLPWALDLYRHELSGPGVALRYVLLVPTVDTVADRGLARPDWGLTREVYEKMHREFSAVGSEYAAHVVDSTDEDPSATLAHVAAGLADGRFDLSP